MSDSGWTITTTSPDRVPKWEMTRCCRGSILDNCYTSWAINQLHSADTRGKFLYHGDELQAFVLYGPNANEQLNHDSLESRLDILLVCSNAPKSGALSRLFANIFRETLDSKHIQFLTIQAIDTNTRNIYASYGFRPLREDLLFIPRYPQPTTLTTLLYQIAGWRLWTLQEATDAVLERIETRLKRTPSIHSCQNISKDFRT